VPLRLAHRGDHRAVPENTLAAFATALAVAGCGGLEFDVRVSRGGVPIVLHDETLQRVQGRPERAAALTPDELAAFGIPTLEAALAMAPSPAFLDVELKEDVAAAAVVLIRAARGDRPPDLVVSSFDPSVLEAVGREAPGLARWLNADDLEPTTIALAGRLGCTGISAERRGVTPAGMARARAAGLVVAAWTVTDRAEADRLAALGVVALCVEGEALGPA
jgi:glycerophosphoryl diester phosphodiesterase